MPATGDQINNVKCSSDQVENEITRNDMTIPDTV